MSAFTATRTLTDDVIAALQAEGLTVGDATGEGLSEPYVVVFPIQGTLTGTMGNPYEDGRQAVQITSVGVSRRQAEWARDKARAVMLAGFPVTGTTLQLVHLDIDSGVRRDDDVEPPVFIATERFRLFTTPTT